MNRSDDRRLRDLCAQRHEDDTDPRLDQKLSRSRETKPNRKDRQLCKQVFHALEHAILSVSSRSTDPMVIPVGIEPDPDASRLVITLACASSTPEAMRAAARTLGVLAPALRAELARTLTRKRLPGLRFVLLPAPPIVSPDPEVNDV